MKAILTKSEKERLLEQFEKSGKTHAQFAQENGLYEMYEFETDWYQEVLNFCNHYEVKLDEYKSGYSNNYIYYLEIPALQFSSQGEGRSPEVARLKAAEALRHDCEIYDMKQEHQLWGELSFCLAFCFRHFHFCTGFRREYRYCV